MPKIADRPAYLASRCSLGIFSGTRWGSKNWRHGSKSRRRQQLHSIVQSFVQRTGSTTIKQTLGVAKLAGNHEGQGRAASAAAGRRGMQGAGGTRYEKALAQEKEIELAIKTLDHRDPDYMAKLMKLCNALQQAGE